MRSLFERTPIQNTTMAKSSSNFAAIAPQSGSPRVIVRIETNHPARVRREHLTPEALLEAARARKMEYVSPLAPYVVGLEVDH